ncbi:MAG: hypothetical protein LUH51_08170 [Firmicutes bacterium]|nr:hypothetical protein [Bacillota bacterium]
MTAFTSTLRGGNVDRLCGDLACEQSTVYRKRDKALRHFTIALYGLTES